jgi:uncharacterized RDD family membrane protein YckC
MSQKESIGLDGKPAGLLRRFAAILYDCLLVLALLVLDTLLFIGLRGGEAVEIGSNLLYQLSMAALVYIYFVGYWTYRGRSLGMQAWGLRVALPDDQLVGFLAASLRFVAALISWLPAGLGFLWQLWDKDKLTWHDRWSGTRLTHYPKEKKNKEKKNQKNEKSKREK